MARELDSTLAERFVCPKCGQHGARVERVAMAGTGISRLFEVQRHRYLFASCTNCGFTETYSLRVLEGRGNLGTLLDILFAD